ncbi:MAG: hypothetical protein WB507_03730 [Solirubrobacterales bacterium]
MATWQEFCEVAPMAEGQELSATAWVFELPGSSEGRTQKVFAFHEVIQPDFGILRVTSAIALITDVDTEKVVQAFGQLLAGAIGYAPTFDDAGQAKDGFLNVASSLPLGLLDLSDPKGILLYLFIVARAADDVEQKISSAGYLDLF